MSRNLIGFILIAFEKRTGVAAMRNPPVVAAADFIKVDIVGHYQLLAEWIFIIYVA